MASDDDGIPPSFLLRLRLVNDSSSSSAAALFDRQLSPEEEYFQQILMKYQPFEVPNDRLITVSWSAIVGAFFIFSTIFGIVGNVTVIVAIAGDKVMRRSAMNILLLNLAVADMLNLMIIVLEWSPAVIYGYPAWYFPRLLCPLARYLECSFLFASILTQLVVCIERYIAIVYPIHVRRLCTRQNIFLLAAAAWSCAFLFSLPYALVHTKPLSSIKCVNPYGHTSTWILYKWFEFLAAYAIPCSVMIFLYGKVACVLWSKNPHLHEGVQRASTVAENGRNEVVDRAEEMDGKRVEARRGIIKMLVACVIVYFVSYSPIQGIFIMTAMFGPNSRPPYSVVLLLNFFALASSACNPLLYTLFSKKFRMRIIHLLTCGRHGSIYSRGDITYSFGKKFKKRKRLRMGPENRTLLLSNATPDETRRCVTPTSTSLL